MFMSAALYLYHSQENKPEPTCRKTKDMWNRARPQHHPVYGSLDEPTNDQPQPANEPIQVQQSWPFNPIHSRLVSHNPYCCIPLKLHGSYTAEADRYTSQPATRPLCSSFSTNGFPAFAHTTSTNRNLVTSRRSLFQKRVHILN